MTNFILYNVKFFVSDVDIYLCYKYISFDLVSIEKYLKLLIKFQRLSKMAKYFQFTNNNSDVYVVGNSQLTGFKGISKDKDRSMNISMFRGAQIQDCLAECDTRYRHKRNKVKLQFTDIILLLCHSISIFYLDGSHTRVAELCDGHKKKKD